MSEVDVHRVPAEEAGELVQELGEVYREVFAEPPYEYGDEHVQLFRDRFEKQRQRTGAALVVARDEARAMAGFGFGLTLPSAAAWWTDLTTEVDPGLVAEPPNRTFVLVELLVREQWRSGGVAARLHDALLADRATLTVRPEAEAAQHAYERWGWQEVARKRNPLPGAPIYDVLVKQLNGSAVD